MHYKNGEEAKIGDTVRGTHEGQELSGVVTALFPGSTACNIQITNLKPFFPVPSGSLCTAAAFVAVPGNGPTIALFVSTTTSTAANFERVGPRAD